MGSSALTGAIGHGFTFDGSLFVRILSWNLLAVAVLLAEFASLKGSRLFNQKIQILLLIKTVVVVLISWKSALFTASVVNVAIGMFGIVLPVHVFLFPGNKRKTKLLVLGVVTLIIPGLIFLLKVTPNSDYLNANDLGHYLTIIPLILIFLGVRKK